MAIETATTKQKQPPNYILLNKQKQDSYILYFNKDLLSFSDDSLLTFGCREVAAPITTLSPIVMPRLASDTLSPPLLPEDDVSLCGGGDLTYSLPCTMYNNNIMS